MSKNEGFFGDMITVIASAIAGVLLVLFLLDVVTAQEDDPYFNCYLSGDMKPGPNCPWHGFVNGFEHADAR